MSLPYLTRLDTADHVANDAVDTLAKRVIASNLDHLANSHGQVLVNWSAADGSGIEGEAVEWGGVDLWRSQPFALRVRSDGAHFSLRVRLRGRRVTHDAMFIVNVSKPGVVSPLGIPFSSSSTTGAWLSPGVGFSNIIEGTLDSTASMTSNIATPITLGGATVAFTEVTGQISVRLSIPNGETAELTGLHVTEFVGA